MSTKYTIKPAGPGKQNIFREEVHVAVRDDATGTLDYLPDMDKYRAPVSGFLKEQGLDKPPVVPDEVAARQAQPRVAGDNVNQNPEPSKESDPAQPPRAAGELSGGDKVAELRRLLADAEAALAEPAELTPEQKRIKELEAQVAALQTKAPARAPMAMLTTQQAGTDALLQSYVGKAPALDPTAGDKTPAFVDWLYGYDPEAAAARYSGRRTHRGLV